MAAPEIVDDQRALIDAGLAVLRRAGSDGLTVADVLAEAGLSTRAFYRHFTSKDELVLAIYARDSRLACERMQRRLDGAPHPRAALEVWIDETLALAFDGRRARRTRPLAREGMHLRAEFPQQFDAIIASVLDPLVAVLQAFPTTSPARDARTIHAVTWELVEERMRGSKLTLEEARAHVLRFCVPAIEASA